MKIVVLGWGSLIWNPRNLRKEGSWNPNGPYLPVEFARISKDGRLTLVLYRDADRDAEKAVQVLWAYMKTQNLREAINNLAEREGTSINRIGYINLINGSKRCKVVPEIEGKIEKWARNKRVDAVIWTDLSSNFKEKTNEEFTPENVIKYLKNLPQETEEKAKEYIKKAPCQIRTKIREKIEKELGWKCLGNVA